MLDERNFETDGQEVITPDVAVQAAEVVETTEVINETAAEEVAVATVVEAPVASDKGTAPVAEEEQEEDEDPLVLVEEVVVTSAHDDYNWGGGKRHQLYYSAEDTKNYLEQYDRTLSDIRSSEIVKGRVTAITAGDVVLDINYKSDGLVSLSEFRDTPDLKQGDEVEVYVEQQEDGRGQLVLSRRKAKLLRAWERIVDSFTNGTIIRGQVISKTKGGLIVDAGGLETFLPGSQIDIKPIIDYDQYVGKVMDFKVVKINEAIKNAVVSHKALIESDLAEQREQIIGGLERGQVLEGVVKYISDFGAFLDLGGVDGLLYITDISWGRISHPTEVLQLNQKINVVVLDFDENKKRISLGLKQLTPHPWEVLTADIQEGSVVRGRIVNIEDYGAFLEIQPGVEGLVHISEVMWGSQNINAKDYFKLSQEYDAKVVTLDRDDRKMSLSIKQLTPDPWIAIAEKFPVGERYTGEVKNITQYGVFVELEQGIGGMVHISDLSWTKRYQHPAEFTKVGSKIDVMILDIDRDSRKLSLGHKQTEDNPWDDFEKVYTVGSYHQGSILRRDDRGAIVLLAQGGLEAFAPIKHIRKEDGSTAEADETLAVKVIEFNRDDKRILVSHTRYLEDIKKEADETVKKQKNAENEVVRKAVKETQSKVEKDTMGDIGAFADLKSMFEANAAEATPIVVVGADPAPAAEETETKD